MLERLNFSSKIILAVLFGFVFGTQVFSQGYSGERLDDQTFPQSKEEDPFSIASPRIEESLEQKVERLKKELEAAELELAEAGRSNSIVVSPLDPVELSSGALVVVESDVSNGSGFIGEIKGKTFFITNIHVLGAARSARVRTIEGIEVPLSDVAFVGSRRDIAMVPVDWNGPILKVSPSLKFDGVSIGEPITVMGNADGVRVATKLAGKVTGIGPEEIEVSAKFVPGNSGSPVYHNELYSVIGVAAYLRDLSDKTKWTEDSEMADIRRFAYRLDGEIDWQRVSLDRLFEEGELFARFEDRSEAFSRISYMLERENTLMTGYREHDSIGYLFNKIDSGFSWKRGTNSANNKIILRRLIAGLLVEIQSDRTETEKELNLTYYKRQFQDLNESRHQAQRSLLRFQATRL